MTTYHRWFRSGSYSLLAHVDLPDTQEARAALLIVPPFGWEDICSYRPLRALARSLALQGFPVLRFDLPGTGDSSGSALDAGLLPAWIRSVKDAAAELRMAAGVAGVAVLGIRLGAMLALAAAGGERLIDSLILWGASANGRTILRELRAFRNLEDTACAAGQPPPPQPIPGLEVGGFLLNSETEKALEAFSLADHAFMPGRRVLFLSRDNLPHDNDLVRSLEKAGCRTVLKTGVGYAAMMAPPDEALCPHETERVISEFLRTRNEIAPAVTGGPGAMMWKISSCSPAPGIVETVCPLPQVIGSLFSVATQPAIEFPSSDWCLLFLNSGSVRHIGCNRMWVEAARRWASNGVPSIRFDFRNVGESDGDRKAGVASLYEDDLVAQLDTVLDAAPPRLNCRRFLALGLCSGAYGAFQGLIHNPAIRGAVLLNPRLFFWDPVVERRRLIRRAVTGLANVSDWRRLARGDIHPNRIRQAARAACNRFLKNNALALEEPLIPAKKLATAWDSVRRFRSRATLIFADGEPLFQEMEEEGHLPSVSDPSIRCIRVGKAGHTFRPMWAQHMIHDLIDREISYMCESDLNLESPKGVAAADFSTPA